VSPLSDWQYKAWLEIANQLDDLEKIIVGTSAGPGFSGIGPNSMVFSKQIYLYTYGTMNYKMNGQISSQFEKRGLKVLDVRSTEWLWNRREMLTSH
jgi:hypothetical protein